MNAGLADAMPLGLVLVLEDGDLLSLRFIYLSVK